MFVFRVEPEAAGDMRAVKDLAGEGDHAVHAVGRGVVDEVLHPGEVGSAQGRIEGRVGESDHEVRRMMNE